MSSLGEAGLEDRSDEFADIGVTGEDDWGEFPSSFLEGEEEKGFSLKMRWTARRVPFLESPKELVRFRGSSMGSVEKDPSAFASWEGLAGTRLFRFFDEEGEEEGEGGERSPEVFLTGLSGERREGSLGSSDLSAFFAWMFSSSAGFSTFTKSSLLSLSEEGGSMLVWD